jgi:ribosomal protein S12 methylthiotransferase
MKPKQTSTIITVGFVPLGCPKNVVDSEKMLADIAQSGMLICADPDAADVIIINTCGFIEPAKAESIEAIERAVQQKETGPTRKVIVAGCLSERMGEELTQAVKGIDALVSLKQRDSIVEIIQRTVKGQARSAQTETAGPLAQYGLMDDSVRLLIGPPHRAYLRISEGCNHRCSFCTIPAIRGPFRSKPEEQVIQEAQGLVSSGVVELNLVAQDTTSYERDLQVKNGLSQLLRELNKIDKLQWIRLLYLYPTGLSDTLIETIRSSQKICPYLDIPIQHAHDPILRAMRRPDTQEKMRRLIEQLRQQIPELVLRSTVIVGFPGETDQAFADLLDFIRWAQFDALGAFPFFPEKGTEAASLPDQVPEEVKQQRLETLMLAQQDIAFAKNTRRMDTHLTCLVDSLESEGWGVGRFSGQAPDIDSVCHIQDCLAQPGEFIKVKVIATENYDLVVQQI